MTYQTLHSLSQAAIAAGLIISAVGGYGAYYFQKKIDEQKEASVRPIIDVCNRGIEVKRVGENSMHFDIPYCAAKNANAHNVKLESAILRNDGRNLLVASGFGDAEFPDGITLTYETGKSISYTLSPVDPASLDTLYVVVRGTYTDALATTTFKVLDIFKQDSVSGSWVRTLGPEDAKVRAFVKSL